MRLAPRLLSVRHDVPIYTLYQGMSYSLVYVCIAPFQVFASGAALPAHALSGFEQQLGGIPTGIEYDGFDTFTKRRIYVFVVRQSSRVDDGHIEARLNRVIQKDRMHGFAQGIVAAK